MSETIIGIIAVDHVGSSVSPSLQIGRPCNNSCCFYGNSSIDGNISHGAATRNTQHVQPFGVNEIEGFQRRNEVQNVVNVNSSPLITLCRWAVEAVIRSDYDKSGFGELIQVNYSETKRICSTARCNAIIRYAAIAASATAIKYDRGPFVTTRNFGL